jgi:hypothetical protein
MLLASARTTPAIEIISALLRITIHTTILHFDAHPVKKVAGNDAHEGGVIGLSDDCERELRNKSAKNNL